MYITFANSQTLNVSMVKEQKRIYALPMKWALTIVSDEDMTSDELDELLTPENIASIEYYNGMETKTLTGYDTVDFVSKEITNDTLGMRIALNITLLKDIEEETENES